MMALRRRRSINRIVTLAVALILALAAIILCQTNVSMVITSHTVIVACEVYHAIIDKIPNFFHKARIVSTKLLGR